jgi:hypothetical protein
MRARRGGADGTALASDPFRERRSDLLSSSFRVFGAHVRFESNSRELLGLAAAAYAGLPAGGASGAAPHFRVRLLLCADKRRRSPAPPLVTCSAPGILAGTTPASSSVLICPGERTALIVVPVALLRFPYYVRYEMIEFAVATLVARARGLVSLHAACVGHQGRGILLLGSSGAGKSTIAMHCLHAGFEFLSEDSVQASADATRLWGVANFLHLRAGSLRWLAHPADVARVRAAPVIRRRSGARKFELDLRTSGHAVSAGPLRLAATVFLVAGNPSRAAVLRRLPPRELRARMAQAQPYAANQPGWTRFAAALGSMQAYELNRGAHPADAVAVLGSLVGLRPAARV